MEEYCRFPSIYGLLIIRIFCSVLQYTLLYYVCFNPSNDMKMYFLVDQVKKRIKSLRTQYGKLKKPLPSGSEAKVLSKKK